MSADFRKAESGTELLARLEGRSSLKDIEPFLFADEGSPIHDCHGQRIHHQEARLLVLSSHSLILFFGRKAKLWLGTIVKTFPAL
ncbi:DNA repair protein XRCC2-like isoform X2 [Macrotis lagotis]|uniref:DNA repair protein XRCC2-like isoform X2 n=1 Tax=Macrotis lagotis TaxID=92651 RepID=UPI003D6944A9